MHYMLYILTVPVAWAVGQEAKKERIVLNALTRLQKRIDGTDAAAIRCPAAQSDVKNRVVIGQIPEGDLRKLVAIRQSLAGELSHLQLDVSMAVVAGDDRAEKLKRSYYQLKDEFEVANAVLWSSLKTDFGIWDRSLRVEGDWQLVAYDHEEQPPFAAILLAELMSGFNPAEEDEPHVRK